MKVTFGYQYFDSDPDEIQKEDGTIDSNKAVELFNYFCWDEQFQGILKRLESNLSSTTPALYFFETQDKFLSISAINNEGFLICFRDTNKIGELFVSRNILIKPEGISVEQFIDDFFSQKIGETLELFKYELKLPKEVQYNLDYNKGKLYRPLLFMLTPFIYLFFDNIDRTLIFPITLSTSGIILLFTLPNLLLNFNYWKNDNNQTIIYNPINKLLTITDENKTLEILKSKIESVELILPRTSQQAFQGYSYLRFKVGDLAFAVTHLTIDPMELLSVLNINFRVVTTFYPKLNRNTKMLKEKPRHSNNNEHNRVEFLETYSNWQIEKLEEIVSKPYSYSDNAIAAAKEILETRKSS